MTRSRARFRKSLWLNRPTLFDLLMALGGYRKNLGCWLFGRLWLCYSLDFGVALDDMVENIPVEEHQDQAEPRKNVADLEERPVFRIPAFDDVEEETKGEILVDK